MQWSPVLIARAQHLYDAGQKPTNIARRMTSECGRAISGEDVRSVIDQHRQRAMSAELRAEIRAIRAAEWISYTLIAERLGIQACTVENACRGMKPPAGEGTCGKRSVPGQGTRTDLTPRGLIGMPKPEPVQIPAWVPGQLHDLYESIAERDCEEQAAIVCRTLKRGGSVAWL